MSVLTIGYTDGAEYMIRYFQRVLPPILGSYRLEFQANPARNPDLLFCSLFGTNAAKYSCKKIFLSGEPNNVSHIHCDLLIDCKNVPTLRRPGVMFLYLPFYVLSFCERFHHQPHHLIKAPSHDALSIAATKSKFCAFLYSQNVDFRNQLYDTICKYKKVDALGAARGSGGPTDRQHYQPGNSTYNDLAVQKYQPYKFVICCENSRHPGYVTEKIISAMLANAIPIYLGAPDIVDHFNPDSFVNVGAYANWEQALQKIRELDTNVEMYKQMVEAPWFRNNVLPPVFSDDYLAAGFRDFVNKPRSSAVPRRPITSRNSILSQRTVARRIVRPVTSSRVAIRRLPVRRVAIRRR